MSQRGESGLSQGESGGVAKIADASELDCPGSSYCSPPRQMSARTKFHQNQFF